MNKIYTARDVCKALGITYRMLDYHLNFNIDDVGIRTSSNMRIFTEQDIQRIKNHLSNRNEKKP